MRSSLPLLQGEDGSGEDGAGPVRRLDQLPGWIAVDAQAVEVGLDPVVQANEILEEVVWGVDGGWRGETRGRQLPRRAGRRFRG